MSDLIGQSFGRYHIIEQLGEGGMATVYKAYDTRLETDVAIKVIRTENLPQNGVERALKRFEREAKALAKLTHPNIVKVTDYGEFDGSPYLVMPYLPGGNLKHSLHEHGRMPWQEAVHLLLPIAQALEFAHSQGVIHRDVKPANILLTQSGQPMLTDFGVAKVVEEEATSDLTGTAAAVGTPEYMAPEQTGKNIDHRVDIYALGIVFYELISGRRPYEADTPLAVLVKQASEPLPRPSQFVPSLPDRVEKVLLKALAKNPSNRYQTLAEFAKALENLSTKTKSASEPSLYPRSITSAHVKKSRQDSPKNQTSKTLFQLGWIFGGCAALIILAILGIWFYGYKFSHATVYAQPTITSSLVPTELPTFTPSLSPSPPPSLSPSTTALLVPDDVLIKDWPMYSHDVFNTAWNAGEDTLFPPLKKVVEATIPCPYIGAFTIVNGEIYLGCEGQSNNEVYALSQEGKILWHYLLKNGTGSMENAPTFSNGTLFFGAQGDDSLYSFNTTSKSINWLAGGFESIYSSPSLVDKNTGIVIGFGSKKLAALQVSSGRELWSINNNGWAGRLALWNGKLAALAWNTPPLVVNLTDGKLLWQRTDLNTYFSDLITYNGIVYFGGRLNIYALDLGSGVTKWTIPVPNSQSYLDVDDYSLALADGILYVAGGIRLTDKSPSPQNTLFAIDTQTGKIIWQSEVSVFWRRPIVANGVVYAVHQSGADKATEIAAFNAKTGSRIWQLPLPPNTYAGLAIANAKLYIFYESQVLVFENDR